MRPISLALPSSPFTLSRSLLLCVPFRALFSIALLTSKLVVLHCTEDRDRYNLAGIVAIVFELNYFVVVEVGLSIGVLVEAVSLYQVQANTTSRYVLKSLSFKLRETLEVCIISLEVLKLSPSHCQIDFSSRKISIPIQFHKRNPYLPLSEGYPTTHPRVFPEKDLITLAQFPNELLRDISHTTVMNNGPQIRPPVEEMLLWWSLFQTSPTPFI
ncbi:hypothetical protein GmHk_14G041000 [Glycine max]|nr:hypothetical protein GmHk_14G041000 [Glycine max]